MAGSVVDGDDDEVVGAQRLSSMASSWKGPSGRSLRVIVQEKVDGANVGVHFPDESSRWEPTCQKRGGVICQGERHAQYGVFKGWAAEHSQELWEMLGTRLCLFGEFLWARHAVSYDSLPEFFVAFDALDKGTNRFLSHSRLRTLVAEKFPALAVVPLLWDGTAEEAAKACSGDLVTWLRKLANRKSSFGSEQAEGVYVRIEDSENVLERFKLRRQTFVAGRQDFASSVQRNALKK